MADDAPELRDWLRRLAGHLPAFESPSFTFGSWVPSQERDDGVIVLGWHEPSPEADVFLADVRGWIAPFHWPAWAAGVEGQALLGESSDALGLSLVGSPIRAGAGPRARCRPRRRRGARP